MAEGITEAVNLYGEGKRHMVEAFREALDAAYRGGMVTELQVAELKGRFFDGRVEVQAAVVALVGQIAAQAGGE